jgi:four helix bundle protein
MSNNTFKSFEEIKAWQKARLLAKNFGELLETHEKLNNSYKLRDQMERSSGSIMDNIAEGFGRMGNGEFSHFVTISIGSAREFQSQLYRCLDRKFIAQEEFDALYNMTEEICKMLLSLISYLGQSEIKGIKFKKG